MLSNKCFRFWKFIIMISLESQQLIKNDRSEPISSKEVSLNLITAMSMYQSEINNKFFSFEMIASKIHIS